MDENLHISPVDVRKILGAGSGDAALVYLHLRSGGSVEDAPSALRLSQSRVEAALQLLRQLGLTAPEKQPRYLAPSEPPAVSDEDLKQRLTTSESFRLLVGETQRQLGRILSTEELRSLANITGYLGLGTDVVGILITYCLQRSAERGAGAPTMRAIEKTAYRWADEGIDTVEQAAAYLHARQSQNRTLASLSRKMGLGRPFRAPEEEKIRAWLELGFGAKEIYFAFERCVMSTGELKWPYMDKIIRSWHSQGLHTLARIQEQDQRPGAPAKNLPGRTTVTSADNPGELEQRMVQRLNKVRKEGS